VVLRRHHPCGKPDFTPRVAFILGSGLGALADQIDDAVAISYEKLPGFPVSTVHGHAGELVLGHLAGVPVACMKGVVISMKAAA
jgi:xanthosine phosphorylase